MKLALVTVLAIALLPHYRLAAGEAKLFASFTSNPLPGWPQPGSQVTADLRSPDTGTPEGKRTPGGTRGGACKQTDKQTDQPFTALVPEKAQGLTAVGHPVFWFFIPDAPEDIQSIEFSLHDRNDTTTLYLTSLPLTRTQGVIGIPLPSSPEYSLKLNESYHWRLIINCDQKETSKDPIVLELEGWVTRVQESPNLWHDELTNLAKRYLSEPQNPEVKKAWVELMQSVGLEGLAQEPMVTSVGNSENNSIWCSSYWSCSSRFGNTIGCATC
jgi:hypothetical protein